MSCWDRRLTKLCYQFGEIIMGRAIDLLITYRVIKMLVTPLKTT